MLGGFNDFVANFKTRPYKKTVPHIRLHYSKCDERLVLIIIDKKRIYDDRKRIHSDRNRLIEINKFLQDYFIRRDDVIVIQIPKE